MAAATSFISAARVAVGTRSPLRSSRERFRTLQSVRVFTDGKVETEKSKSMLFTNIHQRSHRGGGRKLEKSVWRTPPPCSQSFSKFLRSTNTAAA